MHLQIRIICMTPADRLSTLRPLNFAPCFLLPADAPLIHGKSSPAILRFLPPPLSLLRSRTIKRHEALNSPGIGKAFPGLEKGFSYKNIVKEPPWRLFLIHLAL